MRIVADLLETGLDKDRIKDLVYNNFSVDRMKLQGLALNKRMVVLPEFKSAYIYLTKKDFVEYNYAKGDTDGFVKVIFDAKYGEWLGCHLVGDGVTDMIAEAVVARNLETTGHEIIKSVHPHPTLSEAIMEAAAAAYGEVIHI
jgi:hypothetical protein